MKTIRQLALLFALLGLFVATTLAREYSPAMGRYIQPDPIGLDGGINRFPYAESNPVNLVDPNGLSPNGIPKNPLELTPLEGGGGAGFGGPTAGGRSLFGSKAPQSPSIAGQCPPEVKNTLARIKAGEGYPHRNDGAVFQNREGMLPVKPNGYYREWVHPTADIKGPGAQRLVTGQGGEAYFSPDHYRTFIPVSP